jgi:trans-aconitate 2-methyltransferase
VLEWTRGTTLRPVLKMRAPAEGKRFPEVLAVRLARALPRRSDGTALFPFGRPVFTARRRW